MAGDGLSVSEAELELWETFRPDLYEYVRDGEIWKNPDTGRADGTLSMAKAGAESR